LYEDPIDLVFDHILKMGLDHGSTVTRKELRILSIREDEIGVKEAFRSIISHIRKYVGQN